MSTSAYAAITAYLHAQMTAEQPLFAIVDAAQASKAIFNLLNHASQRHTKKAALFEGERAQELASVAPYLVQLSLAEQALLSQLVEQGWQQNWAIYFSYPNRFDNALNKLRLNLPVKSKDEIGLFRFYDPRVFRLYVPSFDAQQLREFFGAISQFWLPPETGEPSHGLLGYRLVDQQLEIQQINPVQNTNYHPLSPGDSHAGIA
ncbi:MAG: hypothetical protein CTY18_10720 [Methylomonas sp.]|nr:MAG: hypothetical protein CTY24_12410 [Methylobacter sp.]PPD32283.1 MAG: hypothetical protein CTY18_10720 [Methylomonas sp.]